MKVFVSTILILIGLNVLAADDFARVTLQGVVAQSGERLVLRSEGMVYDLNFRSAATRDDALNLIGHTVVAQGRLDLTAKPAQRSRLIFWPERIADVEATVDPVNRPAQAAVDPASPQAQPEGQVPERLVERPVRLPNFDPGEVFEGPEEESILPQIKLDW
ncbi:MAG TPA: hypothetical protein VEK08_17245 [Planctomycetota bacterium]|nr:hypothetical protein [Planctomycetota bacterium]